MKPVFQKAQCIITDEKGNTLFLGLGEVYAIHCSIRNPVNPIPNSHIEDAAFVHFSNTKFKTRQSRRITAKSLSRGIIRHSVEIRLNWAANQPVEDPLRSSRVMKAIRGED